MICNGCAHRWFGKASSEAPGYGIWWCRAKKQRMAAKADTERRQIAFPEKCDKREELR